MKPYKSNSGPQIKTSACQPLPARRHSVGIQTYWVVALKGAVLVQIAMIVTGFGTLQMVLCLTQASVELAPSSQADAAQQRSAEQNGRFYKLCEPRRQEGQVAGDMLPSGFSRRQTGRGHIWGPYLGH